MVLLWLWTPEYHAQAYFTGFVLGYILYLKNKSLIKINISRTQSITGWTLSLIAIISVQYIKVLYHYGHTSWNQTFSALWSSMAVLFWSLGIGWIIISCSSITESTNSVLISKVVYSILSWSPFRPLARISYMVYLTHMLLIWFYSGSRSTLIETSTLTGIYILIPHIVCSYILGFICTILVESPFIEMQKIFLGRSRNNRIKIIENNEQNINFIQ